jgi:MGT family glycosyltransferase
MRSGARRVLVATWGSGGNLPPLLAAANALGARGHHVTILTSAATRSAAERAGLDVIRYSRAPDPDTRVAFEAQAEAMLAVAAGAHVASDTRAAIAATRAEVAVVDCMLPAAIAAGHSMGCPTVSLVHFLYGPARTQMLRQGGAWTTDLERLNATQRFLGLAPFTEGLAAWEAPELVLVTAPRWFDLPIDFPPNVTHAGPLGVRVTASAARPGRRRVLLSFSTTVMTEQEAVVQRVCDALADVDVHAILTLGPAFDAVGWRIPANVHVVPYAEHDEVLPGCAAAVTHGGLGTTLRALAHGVPLLVLPLGRDQGINAARVVDLGAGIRLASDDGPARIATALRTLLGDPSFAAAATRAADHIAAGSPDDTAVAAVESLIE